MNPISAILTPVGVILLIVLGYRHYPWPMAMLWSFLTLGVAWALIRANQIAKIIQSEGFKSMGLIIYAALVQIVIGSILYLIGCVIAKIFR